MAITQTTYTGNGSTTNYSFTFEYLKQADVKVTLDTVATTAFTFANATTLSFTTAPANGVAIRIFRDTVIDALSATFFPGSAIKAEDLNENFTQNLYVTQESDAEAASATTTANGAVTTANGAVTTANNAVTTANAADTKADAAVVTANTADTNASTAVSTANAATATANTASSNATTAVNTANTASTNATAAVNTANTASTNASAAVTTANSAQVDATAAVNTANAATTTANTAVTTANTAVTTANTANTNATAAATSASNAQTSANAAQTSANAAQTSATAAQAQATLAADVRNAFTITDSNSDGTFDFVVGDIPIKGNNGVKLPFEGVTYAEEGAIRYNNSLDKIELYNGAGQWVTAAGGAAVSSSPPSLPSAGDVWYDHDNGRAYVYYNDGDSSQWVEMNPSWNGYVADNSVTTAKIADDAVTAAKLANTSVTAGSYTVSSITVDAQGRVTAASSGTASDADKIVEGNTEAEVVDTGTDGHFKVTTEGTERLRIDSSGNVGVGTSSPLALYRSLSIHGPANDQGGVLDLATANQSSRGYVFTDSNGLSIQTATSHPILFKTNNSERLRIDSSGNVGIGESSPISYDSGARQLVVKGSTNAGMTIRSASNKSGSLYFADGTTGNEAYRGRIEYNHTDDRLQLGTAGTGSKVVIDNSGNCGIGVTNPQTGLHISDGSSLAAPQTTGAGRLTIQNSSSADIQLMSANTGYNHIFFGDQDDANAGVIYYQHSGNANALVFMTSAAERMRVDSSGRVGIGTTTPTFTTGSGLHIAGSSGALKLQNTTNGDWAYVEYADESNTTKFIQGYRDQSGVYGIRPGASLSSTSGISLDSLGNVGIGTTSPTELLSVDGNIWLGNTAGSETLRIWNDSSISRIHASNNQSALTFGVGGHTSTYERMRILSDGSIKLGADPNVSGNVGTDATGFKFVHGGGFWWATHGANSYWNTKVNTQLNFRRNGSQVGSININGTNTSYSTSSDYRLKENVVDLDGAITRVKQLAPKRFNFIADADKTVDGFLAHEAQTVVPEAVTGTKDEVNDDGEAVIQGIDQAKLVPLLTAALQEAIAKIETLETKVNALEGA